MSAQATAARAGRDPASPIRANRTPGARSLGAPAPGSTRRSWRPLLAAALLWALWAVCLIALRELFVGAAWTGRALVLAAAVLAAAGALRSLRPRSGTLAWLLGALAGAALLGWWGLADGRLAAWLIAPQQALQQTWLAVSAGVPPMELSGPLLDVVLAAWFAGLLLSVLLSARFGLLLAAGLPSALLMLAPVTVTSLRVSPPLLLAAGALLLLLLWLEAPPAAGRWRGIAAAGIALALAAGIMAALPPSRDRVWNASAVSVGPVSASVPDVTIALGEELRSGSGTVAFDYRVDDRAAPVRFTLAVLDDFERGTWLPEDALDASGATVDAARNGGGATGGGADPRRREASVTVRSQGLVSSWLPLPQTVQRVEAVDGDFDPGSWNWVAGTATARSDTALTRPRDAYRAVVGPEAFGSLRVAERYTAEQLAEFDPEPYTELPAGMPAAITEAAQEATASVDADLELLRSNPGGAMHYTSGTVVPSGLGEEATRELLTAASLEQWFRSGDFAYDVSAPYEPGLDRSDPYAVMETFLEQRSGYCVHYASTFAVMARSLGLPTRVAVGYVSRPADDGWTPVRARELHAWPEVFVTGIGWVAFEPTPGGAGYRAETGQATVSASAPAGEQSSPLQAPDTPIEREQPQDPARPDAIEPGATAETEPGAATATGHAVPAPLAALLGTLGVMLLLLGIAPALRALRRAQRMRRARRGHDPASQLWAEFVDTAADLGLHRPGAGGTRARTPEALVEHLAGRGLLGTTGAEAAGALARAVVAERFSGAASTAPSRAEARLAIGALRAGARPRARWRAAFLPRSVLGR
ncbi:transglutaminase-like domain-containing protein [Leucobacter massiliensis]|uniref:Transglutaminase-like domain-containing protein n=1 Tax=Leucobacter massiliensis TaxID=1686285 RepID=A0A2S9QME6_9MICO|nr:transglutaminase-like domain-containing protein [Leucobacter massiliensis]PRI10766.1 hypothetical protein B4915_07645 [Leucobacter massiliensis]